MSAFALISGRLHGEATTRPTRTGGQVTFFTLRVANGSAIEYWNVATFSEAIREELAKLPEGAPVSCSGGFHAEIQEWKGATRLRLKLTADSLLALRPEAGKAKAKTHSRGTARRANPDPASMSWAAPAMEGV